MPDDLRALIVDTTPRTDGLLPVRRAIAKCATCEWTAIMTGDSDEEIAEFLRLLLMDHVTTLHPRH